MSSTLSPGDYRVSAFQKEVQDGLVACCCIALVFVVLRCFVRVRLQAQFSIDDTLLVVGMLGFILMNVFLVLSIHTGGFGRKTAELPLPVFLNGIKYLVLCQTTYVLAMMTTKLSIALLQLRIIGQTSPIMRRINYTSVAVNVITGMYEFFALLFQCTPPEKFWTPTMTSGHCANREGVTIGVYVYTGINLALDWYYALALVPLVWKLQMRMDIKLSTIILLSVGVFASIANIVRFGSLIGYSESQDQLYVFVPITVWTWIEMCLGICTAAVATMRPLIRMLPWGATQTDTTKYSNRTPFASRETPHRRFADPDAEAMEFTDVGIIIIEDTTTNDGGRKSQPESIGDAESQKCILKKQSVELQIVRVDGP